MRSIITIILYDQTEQLISFFILLLTSERPSTLTGRNVRLSNLLIYNGRSPNVVYMRARLAFYSRIRYFGCKECYDRDAEQYLLSFLNNNISFSNS